MRLRVLFLLVPLLWSALASAAGGVLYTCRMKGEASFSKCCCPSAKRAPAPDQGSRLQRVCCEAERLSALDVATPRIDERSRLSGAEPHFTPVAPAPWTLAVVPSRQWEVVARATAPPPDEGLFLRLRSLLL